MAEKTYGRKKLNWILISLLVVLLGLAISARIIVNSAASGRICRDISSAPTCRFAMILGARVKPSGELSLWLKGRVDKGIELYKAHKVQKLLMSGDNRFKNYNEPERMRDYAVSQGVPIKDIALDYAGRRTYDSVYRAKHIFGLDKMIIVTQDFHLSRALFLAKAVGIDAQGFPAPAKGTFFSQIRECFACVSALLDVYVLNPKPVLGEREKI